MTTRGKPARRGNGEGSIYRGKARDRYRAAVTLPDGSRRTATASSQAEGIEIRER